MIRSHKYSKRVSSDKTELLHILYTKINGRNSYKSRDYIQINIQKRVPYQYPLLVIFVTVDIDNFDATGTTQPLHFREHRGSTATVFQLALDTQPVICK